MGLIGNVGANLLVIRAMGVREGEPWHAMAACNRRSSPVGKYYDCPTHRGRGDTGWLSNLFQFPFPHFAQLPRRVENVGRLDGGSDV